MCGVFVRVLQGGAKFDDGAVEFGLGDGDGNANRWGEWGDEN